MSETPRTWEAFWHERSGLVSEMIGAADFFDKCPEAATDAQLAKTFRDYVTRARAIELPASASGRA